ncbi:hypothetical protein [Ligilactobacillus acidipiscis]|uniref:hypothetical protein n=1 Tax=Ligilactobacillus acidipiscis TaxID=89059 RepID=UPI0012E91AF5|nr:hypothetical protein [Ligilactobacillus acidipiscis]
MCNRNVSQYVSIVAVMIQNENTIDDLAQADILYEQGNGMPCQGQRKNVGLWQSKM